MESLREDIKKFAEERDWGKYHSPKNLAMALSVEASELLEIFLWLTETESQNLTKLQLKNLKEEIGDVMIYLINISSKFGLDPIECAKQKIELNMEKYPVSIVKGSSKNIPNTKIGKSKR